MTRPANLYRGMRVSFVKTVPRTSVPTREKRSYLVELHVPYSGGGREEIVPLGYATRAWDDSWTASRMDWGLVCRGLRLRWDCIHQLYVQRFGWGDLK